MQDQRVAIFWDFENVCASATTIAEGVASKVESIARQYGSVTQFRAYMDLSRMGSSSTLRFNLQSSGVTVVDCPHNGRKDVADKVIIVDSLAFALDQPAPATIVLISGDCDFAYAVSTLRLRGYGVVLIAPKSASASLKSVASQALDWRRDVLGRDVTAASVPWGGHHRIPSSVSTGSDYVHIVPETDFATAGAASEAAELGSSTLAFEEGLPALVTTLEVITASEIENAPSCPIQEQSSINGDGDDLQSLHHSILPYSVFQHLLGDSRPCSPAVSNMVANESKGAPHQTFAISADHIPPESPFCGSSFPPASSADPSSWHPTELVRRNPYRQAALSSGIGMSSASEGDVSNGYTSSVSAAGPGDGEIIVAESLPDGWSGAEGSDISLASSFDSPNIMPAEPAAVINPTAVLGWATGDLSRAAVMPQAAGTLPLNPPVAVPSAQRFISAFVADSLKAPSRDVPGVVTTTNDNPVAPARAKDLPSSFGMHRDTTGATIFLRSSLDRIAPPGAFHPGPIGQRVATRFRPLVRYLESQRLAGCPVTKKSLTKKFWAKPNLQREIGQGIKLKTYLGSAAAANIIDMSGGSTKNGKDRTITLKSRWHGATF